MTVNAMRRGPVWQWLLCYGLLVALVQGVMGCATGITSPEQAAGGTDLLTDSDEPVLRKRARIRLELALAYFERGQTEIALDELKQSMSADPMYSEAHDLKGLIYMRLNEPRLAEASFRRALEISPKDAGLMQNLAWFLCQQARYPEAETYFLSTLANPKYDNRAKTFRTQGLCQIKAGQTAAGAITLLKSYEIEPSNPITGFNLASAHFLQSDFSRAQFFARRLNNSDLANAESLWLGIKIEQRLKNSDAMDQLATQLLKRFPKAKETDEYQRGAFHE